MNELGYPGAVELCSHPENYGRQAPARPNRAAIGLALYVECSPPGAHPVKSASIADTMTIAALAMLALASFPVARASEDNRAPDLPSPLCDRLQVQAGNRVAFHVYALGVQIYRWDGTSWVFGRLAASQWRT